MLNLTNLVSFSTFLVLVRSGRCQLTDPPSLLRPRDIPTLGDADNTTASYTGDALFRSSVLIATNAYRTLFSAAPVAWNDSLAGFAADHAAGCTFHHSGGPYGENIAAGYASAAATVQAWGDESAQYDFGKPGFSEATGHFTQLVWKHTATVGCGRTECDGRGGSPGWFVVCEYWPRGNVIGQFDEEVGRLNETAAAGSSSMSMWGLRASLAAGRGSVEAGWSAVLGCVGAAAWLLA